MPILPNHRLMARAFHRVYPSSQQRLISTTHPLSSKTDEKSNSSNWTGRKAEEHVVQSDDSHNVQKEASKAGMNERAKGETSDSGAVSEKDSNNSNAKAKKDHPEAPGPVLGMNDERGGKGQ